MKHAECCRVSVLTGHVVTMLNVAALCRNELRDENLQLVAQKAELRKILREFENGFIAKNGRYE